MQIKTVSNTSEAKFDEQVNELLAQGWNLNISTYRASGWAHAEGPTTSPAHGAYNSIVLTKEF